MRSSLLALCALCPLQESTVGPQGGMETIVTAPRARELATDTPVLRTIVERVDIDEAEERSLPRALGRAGNLWVQETNLGGGAPVINGLIGNRVLLVLDGMRLNDATTRMVHQTLNSIDPAFIERIEILRGPSSVLYGSDAMGGAILLWTKRRRPAGDAATDLGQDLSATLDTSYLSVVEGGRASLELSDAIRDHGWLMIGGLQNWDDLRAGDGEDQDFTGYHGNSFFASWDYAVDGLRGLRATALIDREFDVPRTDRLVAGYGQTQPANAVWNYKLQDRSVYQLTYDDDTEGALAERAQWRFSYRRYDEEREIQRLNGSTFTEEQDIVDTAAMGVDWSRAIGESQRLTWGLDLSTDWIDSTRSDTDLGSGTTTSEEGAFADDSRYSAAGVYIQDEILAWEPVAVTAGLRYSYFDFSFENFAANGGGREDGHFDSITGTLAAARDVGEGARLTATLSQGYRAPNLEDLANNGSFAGGEELANSDLEPEHNWTVHLALDLDRELWNAGFGVYFTRIDDLIGRRLLDEGDPGMTGDETYMRENVGYGEIYGVDVFGDHVLGELDSPWSVNCAVSWTYGRQYDDTTDPLTGEEPYYDVPFRRIPPLHGDVGLRWDVPAFARAVSWAELEVAWAASQNELNPDDETDPRIDPDGTDGWAILNLDFGGSLRRDPVGEPARSYASWNVGVHNILDENYRIHGSGIDAPGLGLVLGLELEF